jgi:ADP-ribose pyrophosphatase YjhB (NUDIX family)
MIPCGEYLKELQKFPTSFRTGVELFQNQEGELEILLDKRSDNDEYYRGQWALFGSAIYMRERPDAFWERFSKNETGIHDRDGDPSWQFCGILETPQTRRHHGMVQVFGRVWHERPKNTKGEWFPLRGLGSTAVVPSEREVLEVALKVLRDGGVPHYALYLGTDADI